jgi:hypothetical protein
MLADQQVAQSEVVPDGDADQDEEDDEDDDVVITTEMPEQDDQQQQQGQHDEQGQMQTNGEGKPSDQSMQVDQQQQQQMQNFDGFDQNMANFGNGGNMNMNMGMNGFNGMMPGFGGMGMPNMMGELPFSYRHSSAQLRRSAGMPGMGMDPSMMFGGNFGGNMGDMSMMGMGMGGMGNGMMGGNLGNFGGMGGGPGFFPDQGNYMQSNYGNAQRQNFSNDRGYGRGFGRGFGRGARGNWNPRGRGGGWGPSQGHQNGFHQQQNGFHNQQGHNDQNQGFQQGPQRTGANSESVPPRRASPVYEARKATPANPGQADDRDANPTNQIEDTNMTGEDLEHAKEVGNQQSRSKQRHPTHSPLPTSAEISREDEDGSAADNPNGNTLSANGELSQIQSVDHSASFEDYDENAQYQQEYGFVHHNGNFGGRGGYRGRGGFGNNAISNATELTPAPAPPVNAPKGPKAMLKGLPNTGWSGRNLAMATPPQKAGTPTPAPQSEPRLPPTGPANKDETRQEECPEQDYQMNDRDNGASRSHSHRRSRSPAKDDDYESDGTYARRKESERRKRKDRDRRHDDDTEDLRKKYRSRSESRTDDGSRRRHRDKDDEQHRSSRSHRDRSRDKDRRRRHEKDDVDDRDDYSRRKSESHHDRAVDQDDHKDSRRGSSRKHSRREDDYEYEDDRKERSHRSSRHDRSSRDDGRGRDGDRERERDRPRAVIEPPSDELGFKIKGSKSARASKDTIGNNKDRRSSVAVQSAVEAPPVPAGDIYAAERAAAQQSRMAKEAQRRNTATHPTSLGKRGREEDETFDAPRGPKGDRGKVKKGKNGRPERKLSYKYEDEVRGGDDDRDASRWR